MFASATQLNLSNYSFRSSVSVPPNSVSFIKLPFLDAYPPPIFIPVNAFTKAATFESNPPRLLLLLFSGLPPSPGGPPGPPSGGPPRFPPPKPPPNPGRRF